VQLTYPGPEAVAVIGDFVYPDAWFARLVLLDAVSETDTDTDRFTVDLAHATLLDCAGIGALVATRNASLARGMHFQVTNPDRGAAGILNLLGLLRVLTTPT
jgi:anti-anti-sigma regulatory factor